MDVVSISVKSRSEFGKKANKALRIEGGIPAVLYGGNENIHFSTNKRDVKALVYTPDFKLAEIEIDGAKYKSFIKDIQFHPVTDEIIHIDFLKLIDGVKVKVEVPVKFKGVSPGIKEGGKMIQQLRKVKIKSLPSDLTDQLVADISGANLGDAIRVRDLELPAGLELMTEGATPIATIEVPRALKSAEAGEEGKAGEEGAAGAGDAAPEATPDA